MDWRQKLYFSFKINNIFTCSVDHFASNINAKDLNVAIVAKLFKSGGHTAFNCQTVFCSKKGNTQMIFKSIRSINFSDVN